MNAPAGPVLGNMFAVRPPLMGTARIAEALRSIYGLQGRLSLLGSERDQNFRLDANGASFVVKIAHPRESASVLALQAAALAEIARNDPQLPVPRLVATLAGEPGAVVADEDGRPRHLRVVTYLAGGLLHEFEPAQPLLNELGQLAGRMDMALAGLRHAETQADLPWNLTNLPQLRPLLAEREGDSDYPLIAQALDDYAEQVVPVLPLLSCGFIHNDLNPHNVVVHEGRIAGILDFGDMARAPHLCELAIAGAYHVAATDDPLAGAAEIVAGYHSVRPLTARDLSLLPILFMARHAMTVLITEHRADEDHDNRDYILRNNPAARRGLRALARLGGDEAIQRLEARCAAGERAR